MSVVYVQPFLLLFLVKHLVVVLQIVNFQFVSVFVCSLRSIHWLSFEPELAQKLALAASSARNVSIVALLATAHDTY